MVEQKKVRISFQLPEELRDAAQEKARIEDVSVSQVLRWYLRAWVNGEAGTMPPESDDVEP